MKRWSSSTDRIRSPVGSFCPSLARVLALTDLSVASALATLYLIGALDDTRSLTPLGRKMAYFPLEPSFARVLLASFEYGCPAEVLSILSILSASSKLFVDSTDKREEASEARRKFRSTSGDHLMILNIVKSYEDVTTSSKKDRREWCKAQFLNERCLWEALDIRKQLQGVCERMDMDWRVSVGEGNEEPVLRSLLTGLMNQAAFLQADGSYKQIMGPNVSRLLCSGKWL